MHEIHTDVGKGHGLIRWVDIYLVLGGGLLLDGGLLHNLPTRAALASGRKGPFHSIALPHMPIHPFEDDATSSPGTRRAPHRIGWLSLLAHQHRRAHEMTLVSWISHPSTSGSPSVPWYASPPRAFGGFHVARLDDLSETCRSGSLEDGTIDHGREPAISTGEMEEEQLLLLPVSDRGCGGSLPSYQQH